jgi:hypothetical protein
MSLRRKLNSSEPRTSTIKDYSVDKENTSISNSTMMFDDSMISNVSSIKSKRRSSGGRRVTADAADIQLLIYELANESASNNQSINSDLELSNLFDRSDLSRQTGQKEKRRHSSRIQSLSFDSTSEDQPNIRRVTAAPMDIHAIMEELTDNDISHTDKTSAVNRRETADFAHVQHLMNFMDDDMDSVKRRESVDTLDLINTIGNLISSGDATNTSNSSIMSNLERSQGEDEDIPDRRITIDPLEVNALISELDESSDLDDTRTGISFDSVDTMDLIGSVDFLIGAKTDNLSKKSYDSDVEQISVRSVEPHLVPVSPRRARRFSIQSPTATINSAVIADVDFNSAQKQMMKSKHMPVSSALKSCMSGRKSAVKRVVNFGSPNAMEFVKDAAASSFTPLTKDRAKMLFLMEQATVVEEAEDQLTAENSRILDEWDRLSNASGYDSDEDKLSVHSSPKNSPKRRRRSSKLQKNLRMPDINCTEDADDSMSVDNSHTMTLPSSLLALMQETEELLIIPSKAGAKAIVPNDILDVSFASEHTQELEIDLHSLIRSVAVVAAVNKSLPIDSPGLADCNKSWIDMSMSHVSKSPASSVNRSLGPLLGLEHNQEPSINDSTDASSNHFNYDLSFSREEVPISSRNDSIQSPLLSSESSNCFERLNEDIEQFQDLVDVVHDDRCSPPAMNIKPSPDRADMIWPSHGLNHIPAVLETEEEVSPVYVSLVQVEDTAISNPSIDRMLDRLQKLNAGARTNSMLQSGTPSVANSRMSLDIRRQTVATSFIQHQETAKKAKKFKRMTAAPETIAEVVSETMPEIFSESEEASATEPGVVVSFLPMHTELLAAASVEQDATLSMADRLCPILSEIEQLKIKLDDMRRTKASKDVKTYLPVRDKYLEPELEIVTEFIVENDESTEPSIEKNDTAVPYSSKDVPSIDESQDYTPAKVLEDVNLTIDIINRLSYCRLRTYKTNEVIIEVAVSQAFSVVINFGIAIDHMSLSDRRAITTVHLDVERKSCIGVNQEEAGLAAAFFTYIMCDVEMQGPLNPRSLDACRDTNTTSKKGSSTQIYISLEFFIDV